MHAWFLDLGIPLPRQVPPQEAAAKPLASSRILGDKTRNGRVTYWDLLRLWEHLLGIPSLGRFLYVSGSEDSRGIGQPLEIEIPPTWEFTDDVLQQH